MQTKRKTIGRTLSAASPASVGAPAELVQRFILKSGKNAVFHMMTIPAEELEEQTFVRFLVNGRDQDALTPESLADITRTIKLHQFFPAIGYRNGDRIEILDGSRRRAAAMLCYVGLNVLVTETEISHDDARQLAADIQTAKEHNLRETGLRLLQLREEGMSQKEIAISENMSAAKVTRAIQAASVPGDIVSLFPVQSELGHGDYKILLLADKIISDKDLSREAVLSDVNDKVRKLTDKSNIAADVLKKVILSELKASTDKRALRSKAAEVEVQLLRTFDDKNVFARKRVKDRCFSYEFNRVPKLLQDNLDQGIQEILAQFYEQSDD